MRVRQTRFSLIPGALRGAEALYSDDRGSLRTIDTRATEQGCLVYSPHAGTLRGLHYQKPPYAQQKALTVLRGEVYDIIVDLRPESPTYGRWACTIINAKQPERIVVPKGVAHGYQTTLPDTLVLYMVSDPYVAEAEEGVAFDDPGLSIPWPLTPVRVNDRDRTWPHRHWPALTE